jgi:tetratricopeptide (TPR) repeat protein
MDVPPLAPPDLASPYASPRDAARHRLQIALAQLQSSRDLRVGVRGFAEAFVADRTYAPAAFDLGVIAAIAEKWEDALAAFEEAARLDPSVLGKDADPTIERLRKICALESNPAGKLRRRYDEALYPVLQRLPKLQPAEAMQALAEIGRIDPKRWEAPALMASINGNGQGYDVAARFLEIAVANAADPQIKARLQKALDAAQRELRYDGARAAADAAADRGEFDKAGPLYEKAWVVIPARASNGMEAAAAALLHEDTARASALLVRLRESGDPELSPEAGAMLKQLEPIEPAAKKSGAAEDRDFFRDLGTTEPVILSDMIPAVDTANMEMLARPLPKLVTDPAPVVLLADLAATKNCGTGLPACPVAGEADRPGGLSHSDQAMQAPPEPAAPRIAGDNPWREVQQLLASAPSQAPVAAAERAMSTAEIAGTAKVHRSLEVTSAPAGARIFVGDSLEPACETPCRLQAAIASYTLRISLAGYRDETRDVRVTAKGVELDVPLELVRGNVIVDAPGAVALKVNGAAVTGQSPVEIALAPGLYAISADFGQVVRERTLNLKPGARLRVELRP